jgi:hypothetical protein
MSSCASSGTLKVLSARPASRAGNLVIEGSPEGGRRSLSWYVQLTFTPASG